MPHACKGRTPVNRGGQPAEGQPSAGAGDRDRVCRSIPSPRIYSVPTSTALPTAGWGCPWVRCHSRREARYRCTVCGKTFAATVCTPF